MDLNFFGLVLNIIGSLILVFYGFPSRYIEPPKLLLEGNITDAQEKKNRTIKFMANLGLIVLCSGFILQLIDNIC